MPSTSTHADNSVGQCVTPSLHLLLIGLQTSSVKVISEDSEVVCLALHCIYASLRYVHNRQTTKVDYCVCPPALFAAACTLLHASPSPGYSLSLALTPHPSHPLF